MLQLSVTAIGRSMPGWVAQGWESYVRRLPPQISLELDELPHSSLGDERRDQQREGEALLKRSTPATLKIALDGGGKLWSTDQLVAQLERWMSAGQPVRLLVGGANGHGDELLNACSSRWSLGPLTLPHMLVRVILAEQIYRAWTVLSGHPYHRA